MRERGLTINPPMRAANVTTHPRLSNDASPTAPTVPGAQIYLSNPPKFVRLYQTDDVLPLEEGIRFRQTTHAQQR